MREDNWFVFLEALLCVTLFLLALVLANHTGVSDVACDITSIVRTAILRKCSTQCAALCGLTFCAIFSLASRGSSLLYTI